MQGVEQHDTQYCDHEEPDRMPQGIKHSLRNKRRGARRCRVVPLTVKFHPMQQLTAVRRLLIAGRGCASQLECIGDLAKALAFLA